MTAAREPRDTVLSLQPPGKMCFSVGICASGESAMTLSTLMQVVESETLPPGFSLARIVVVASAPSNSTLELLRGLAANDDRILLIQEDERKGKIDAVNTIIRNHVGSYLVFVNADAVPERGAIAKLITKISSERRIGAVSGCPTFVPGDDLSSRVLEFIWAIHNASALELNHRGLSNHASDELMVVRSEALPTLPNDVVNDGAYISGRASAEGYRILFADGAKVTIDVPSTVFQLIEQRRRILFGHTQVWKKLGRPPLTIESLMLKNPALSISLVGRAIASRPSRLAVVPVAMVAEAVAGLLSIKDRLSSTERHTVWKRYRR